MEQSVQAGSVLLQYGIAGAVLFILFAIFITYIFKYAIPQNIALQNSDRESAADVQKKLIDELNETRKRYEEELRQQRIDHVKAYGEQRDWFHRENEIWRGHVVEMMNNFVQSIKDLGFRFETLEKSIERDCSMTVALAEILGNKKAFISKVEMMTGESGLHKKYSTNETMDSTQ